MAIPKDAKAKLAIIALEDAADEMDDGMKDDAEEADETCRCPKCGFKGPSIEFELEE